MTIPQEPQLVEVPKNQQLKAGSTLSLTCKAIGEPRPEILWLQNGTLLPEAPPTDGGQSTLRVLDVKPQHSGEYVCLARNEHGTSRAAANVAIMAEGPQNVQLHEGAPEVAMRPVAVLSCNRGRPDADVRWTKWGRVLTSDHHLHLLANGSLVVYDTGHDTDLGVYNCLVDKEPAIIEVYKTRVFETLPRVLVGPKRQELSLKQALVIHCRVEGANPLTTSVQWSHNGLPLRHNLRFTISPNNSLSLPAVQPADRGVYKCTATNGMGNAYDEALVTIEGLPQCTTIQQQSTGPKLPL